MPVVPGTFEPSPIDRPDQIEAVVAAAERIGFPLFVKASAGGGGRGMRRVASATDLPAALAAGAAEALAAFGDGAVYLEREVRPARHIEVQLLGDAGGDVVALGERDCSVQRRHQKLVEESPAPGLTADERAELHDMAVRAARAAGLHNAATAEFLFDPDRRFWFLEVNARLQVEHGVTELVTDLDLVAEQLWIAAGEPLSDARSRGGGDRRPRPAGMPSRSAWRPRIRRAPSRRRPAGSARGSMPSGPGVRVDTAIRPGERVPPDYDPMIAKVMTVGRDRSAALRRMRRALDEVVVSGIQTTLPFDRALVRDPAFADETGSTLSTDWVGERWDGPRDRAGVAAVAAIAAAASASDHARRTGAASLRKDDRAPAGSGWRRAGRQAATERWPR